MKSTLKLKALAAVLIALVSTISPATALARSSDSLTSHAITRTEQPTSSTTDETANTDGENTEVERLDAAPENSLTAVPGLTAAEQQMLNLVNRERAKAGIPALKVDMQLTNLARLKSQDMISKRYFSHQSPTYGSPFQMMKRFGIRYRTAGENIAGNPTVQGAHAALMRSPGHRANILNRRFTHIGIGIKKGGPFGMMFTQMFIGR